MKHGLYHKYYKLGLEHFINKHYLKLHSPDLITDIFYMSLIGLVLVISLLLT